MLKICKKFSQSKFHCFENPFQFLNCVCTDISSSSNHNLQNVFFKSYSTESVKDNKFDIAVVGAGIIGLGTALELKKRLPSYNMCVIDKESFVAAHQSSRNSGVIHAGIYYKPGSLRAKLCVEGMHLMYKYCEDNKIPHKRNGKLIIAVNKKEQAWLKDLYDRGKENKVPGLELLEPDQIKEVEPYMTGLQALYSPYTGIVEYGDVTRQYSKDFRSLGGRIIVNFEVVGFKESAEGDGTTCNATSAYPITIIAKDGRTVKAGFVLTCGGLHADKLAQMTGESALPKIMPFRGVYFLLNPEKNCMVKGNIYPVPDPSMPFIGVHFTPKVDGSVWLGPTAMLAYKKEGYSWGDVDFGDIRDMLKFKGLYKFVYEHFSSCIYEVRRSANAKVMWKELQMFMPTLKLTDIKPGPTRSTGVQAQAMNDDGTFSEDFGFSDSIGRILHCRNAPSPAATSSLAIGKYLASIVQKRL